MALFEKKIEEYKEYLQEQDVAEELLQSVMVKCRTIVGEQQERRMSYFEFLCNQLKFVKKRWWILQGTILILLYMLLNDFSNTSGEMERTLGSLSTAFATMIIPEIWKSRRSDMMEIEVSSFYSLRSICAARMLLFGIVDLIMLSLFFVVTYNTVQISIYSLIIKVLIPLNVSACISLKLLYAKCGVNEYVAVFVNVAWLMIWTLIVIQNNIYQLIVEPIWILILLFSFAYIIITAWKSKINCDVQYTKI